MLNIAIINMTGIKKMLDTSRTQHYLNCQGNEPEIRNPI
ncbi:hypothetical protein CRENPOLYSF2_2990009 [Crenothrix polyspora]|uniref:Uncharacterized protein n=1 Tax=Crenothrix polyspora TaxID=360316 RepID=A0A1R4H9E9_9GAMM|nr:hypothetical protein CRENPOLYSF2_2990009 [Crenothrix polyspora]